jgi:hypothetical protein
MGLRWSAGQHACTSSGPPPTARCLLPSLLLPLPSCSLLPLPSTPPPGLDEEESGWKYIHGDVFRFPAHKNLFCAFIGTGTQVFA